MNTATATPTQRIALDLAQYQALVDPSADFHTWIRIPFQERCARAQKALSLRQPNPSRAA
jgi:hypothetical protein